MKKNTTVFRYIAGACFAILAVMGLRYIVSDGFNVFLLMDVLDFAGCALIAVALFTGKSVFISIGAGVVAIGSIIYLIKVYGDIGGIWFPIWFLVCEILYLLFHLVLILVGIKKKSAKQLSFTAGIIWILRWIVDVCYDIAEYGKYHAGFLSILSMLLPIIGAFMIGMASESLDVKAAVRKTAGQNPAIATSSTENQIDQLMKLKNLLDRGILTEDEFEEKKKQILGL